MWHQWGFKHYLLGPYRCLLPRLFHPVAHRDYVAGAGCHVDSPHVRILNATNSSVQNIRSIYSSIFIFGTAHDIPQYWRNLYKILRWLSKCGITYGQINVLGLSSTYILVGFPILQWQPCACLLSVIWWLAKAALPLRDGWISTSTSNGGWNYFPYTPSREYWVAGNRYFTFVIH